jgi:hypothetical protein
MKYGDTSLISPSYVLMDLKAAVYPCLPRVAIGRSPARGEVNIK